MVRMLIPLILMFAGCASDATLADGPTAPSRRPVDLPAIAQLVIAENGIGSPTDDNAPRGCSEFRLDEAQVRRFLDAAEGVDQRDYMHTLDWSPCHARGRIEFGDGQAGVWTIRQFQTGSILFDDGNEVFLYCPTCTWAPFGW